MSSAEPSADFSCAIKVNRSTLSGFHLHADSQRNYRRSPGVRRRNFHCVDAEVIKRKPVADGGLNDHMTTGPLTSHLISGSCPSSRNSGLGLLQTSPHELALALASANTWQEDGAGHHCLDKYDIPEKHEDLNIISFKLALR